MPTRTTLSEIREFLTAEGCAPEPWSTPEAVLQRLYDLLVEKREDERFWSSLKELVSRMDDRRFDPRSLPGFEVLGEAVVDNLIDDLRENLGQRGPGRKSLRSWMSTGAGAGLIAVLLLGISISCGSEDDGFDWTVQSWECQEQADRHDITETDDIDRLCELGDYVKDSDVSTYEKELMLDCLPDMDAARRLSLLEDFQTLSEEDLAYRLSDLTDYGICSPPRDDSGCDISLH